MNEGDGKRLQAQGIDATTYMRLMDRPIAYHRVFADVTGSVTAAVFLSQAQYWQLRVPSHDQDGNPRDGYFYKSIEEWTEETRLTYREQAAARKVLRSLGVLDEEKRGVPARLYFKVDFEALMAACVSASERASNFDESTVKRDKKGKFSKVSALRKTGVPPAGKQGCRAAGDKAAAGRLAITETSSEKTSESSSINKPVAGGDGKQEGTPASRARLSFEKEFGFKWSSSWARFLDENRAVAIMKKNKLTDTAVAKRVMAEWANSVSRLSMKGELADPAAVLVSLLAKSGNGDLAHTAGGDEAMPKWA